MRDTLRDAKGGGRIVRGRVSSAGAIVDGVGFTVSRAGLGDYLVTFLQPFNTPPNVEATVADSSALGQVDAFSATQYTFRVNTASSAGATADRAFAFAAIEQER